MEFKQFVQKKNICHLIKYDGGDDSKKQIKALVKYLNEKYKDREERIRFSVEFEKLEGDYLNAFFGVSTKWKDEDGSDSNGSGGVVGDYVLFDPYNDDYDDDIPKLSICCEQYAQEFIELKNVSVK